MPSPVPLAIMKTHSALSHLCVAVQAGARFDVGGRPGSNHLLEHLVFKAGARYPTRRAVDAALAAEGGEIDAATSLQFMTFYGSIPTAALPKLVDVLQDILFAPLRAAALDEETGIVAQEILDKANDPGNALWERGLAALFPGHPNDHREYGTAESVRRLTIEELSARKKALFVRENMAIGLASGLDDAAARSALRPLLDACPSGAAVRITPPPVAPTQPFVRFVPSSARQPILQLLIRGLPPNGPHLYALDVLVAVAGGALTSRLFRVVREERQLCYRIHMMLEEYWSDASLLAVHASMEPRHLLPALRATFGVLKDLASNGITAGELVEGKNICRGRMLRLDEQPDRVLRWQTQRLLSGHPPLAVEEYTRGVALVTPEDVRRLAALLFEPDQILVQYTAPEPSAELDRVDVKALWAGG